MIKYITLLIAIFLLSGCSQQLGSLPIESKVDIEMEKQEVLPVFKKEIDDNIKREYHHFKTPKGELGFIIMETKTVDNITYRRALNPDKINIEERYYDWKIIQDNSIVIDSVIATTTSERSISK